MSLNKIYKGWSTVLIIAMSLICFTGRSQERNQSSAISIRPAKPAPGEKVTIQFNPKGTLLEHAKSIQMELLSAVFSRSAGELQYVPETIKMGKMGDGWSAALSLSDSMHAIAFQFVGETGIFQDAHANLIRTFTSDGEESIDSRIASAYLALKLFGEQIDFDSLFTFFEDDFESKRRYFGSAYGNALMLRKDKDVIQRELKTLYKFQDLSDGDYLKKYEVFQRWQDLLGLDQTALDRIRKDGTERNPRGVFQERILFDSISRLQDLNSKRRMIQETESSPVVGHYYVSSVVILFRALMQAGNYDEAVALYQDRLTPALNGQPLSSYRTIYEKLILRELLRFRGSWTKASDIAKQAVSVARRELKDPTEINDSKFPSQWLAHRKENLGSLLLLYAEALTKNGLDTEALAVYAEATTYIPVESQDFGSLRYYAQLLRTAGQAKKADSITSLRFQKELTGRLQPAPDFTLLDLDGNTVSLTALKGKVVILDFWSTSCGPCKASLPAMQKAVEIFYHDPEVVFYFINTLERGNNSEIHAKVKDFMIDNQYSFNVLLDSGDHVREAFGVGGIPMKFLIDRQGNIRHQESGFNGDEEGLIYGLASLVDILRMESKK